MSLNDMGGYTMTMPVAPMYGGYPAYGGMGGLNGFGGDGWWIILLLLLGGGMWGGFGMGGWGGMMGAGMMGMDWLYPWLSNSRQISDGFQTQQTSNQISDARSDINRGFGDVQLGIAGLGRQICETGNNITGAVRDGFSAAEIAANGRQMANMQQLFGIQLGSERNAAASAAGIADLKYTVGQEGCADRALAAQNTHSIIDSQNRVGQAILDKLCQLELDGVRRQVADEQRENANLRSENQYLRNQADRVAQTAVFERGLVNEVDALYNRLKNCPVNTVPVYGNQPIWTCQRNTCPNGGVQLA